MAHLLSWGEALPGFGVVVGGDLTEIVMVTVGMQLHSETGSFGKLVR